LKQLGELKEIDLKEVWLKEVSEFTPWLRKNINLLADLLQMDIEISESEGPVGSFSADLIGRDLGTNRTIVIENQLAQTDHQHLGQLLTYAAGREAKIVVWISSKFREEHIQALNWLNESTNEAQSFFGVEIKIIQIGDSLPAPLLTLASKPNEWQKTGGRSTSKAASERGERYRDFWSVFLDDLKKKSPGITKASKGAPQNWCSIGAGRTGFLINGAFTYDNKFRVELYIDTNDKSRNEKFFDQLYQDKEQLEQEIGEELSWEKLENARACRIALYTNGSVEVGGSELDELRNWGVEKIIIFHKTFNSRIKNLVEESL